MSSSRECCPALPEEATTRIEQIADAALRRFVRYGFKRSSMDDIAREAGLAKATIYLHFKGKDDVFRAMMARFLAQVAARCEAVMAQPLPFPDKLSALMLAHFGAGYAAFGDGEHLLELKTVMASIATQEAQAFEHIFCNHATALLTHAAAQEISLGALTPGQIVETIAHAAIGAKMGPQPSLETYEARLRQIAVLAAQAVAKR
ncbi:MAG: helix-turn-helix domain-containing protein [Bosea sp. (in: a-proteobacteria)]|uniref:TetR/AcrR family transcriptional regulator n=1 Tax=Bosea sp. (in: a-proteobacteria) TaxID=1871050 RepID=UPI0027346E9D|nr:TetR/AcrR family transcriptional regulator [Bosea sp. (in: a-proteobacteria)]MDP3256505.1 helix-turn-helix domain-containing protein [Bosea sp. (in: a-proteobacteria)]MDP3318466.1 helix-turn-helix domain-containing protein [Bosea sp. (in: a-proteobacteria)]